MVVVRWLAWRLSAGEEACNAEHGEGHDRDSNHAGQHDEGDLVSLLVGSAREADLHIIQVKDRVVVPHEWVTQDPVVCLAQRLNLEVAEIILAHSVFVVGHLVGVRLAECDAQRRELLLVPGQVGAGTRVKLLSFLERAVKAMDRTEQGSKTLQVVIRHGQVAAATVDYRAFRAQEDLRITDDRLRKLSRPVCWISDRIPGD